METLCPSSGWMIHQGHSTTFTKEENKKFESALAIFDEKTPNRWFKVAAMIPGKSVYDVINQYRELVADVSDIEAGLVPIPGYLASSFTLELADPHGFDVYRKRSVRSCDHERKKGVPWTEDEHRRFLLGLQKHGKGDWRNISRNFVISKTPTQVASHAQKYYLRQSSGGKDKRRPSIHDITTVSLTGSAPTDSSKSPPSEKCNVGLITSVQNSTNSPKIVLDWNQNNNDEALMVFNTSCIDTFVAHPHDIATHSRYVVNNVGSGPGFCMQLPRFYA
ncbi:UNVERIFIED_CONTAM: Transcription factor DIVARICATA [Sesamum angustifolium]|uniref:Transcription factor DIVARICATA n=1 Tax=Sesamum angustifolium TaxID=2727405 RepID=A0AAW2LF95_9LAMI